MQRPSPAMFELARRLLRHEAADARTPEALAAAADRASDTLRDELEKLIGPGGATALNRRARALARRDFPFLDAGSAEVAASFEQAEAANAAVLANLLGLLVGLMGEDLALRPVRKVWPEVACEDPSPHSMETEG